MAKKIVIADDEPHIRFLIEQVLGELEDEGVELFLAEDGKKALELIEQEKPQLVFLDGMMPQMDGYTVCSRVKKTLGLEGIHIVMVTARGQNEDRQKGEVSGANLYLTKPFNPDTLLEIAETVLFE